MRLVRLTPVLVIAALAHAQISSPGSGTAVNPTPGTVTIQDSSGTPINTNYTTFRFFNGLTSSQISSAVIGVQIDQAANLTAPAFAPLFTIGTGGVTAGQVVKIVNDGTAKATGTQGIVATTTTSDTEYLGVALDSGLQGASTRVAVSGMVQLTADNAVTARDLIGIGSTTAGRGKDLGATLIGSVAAGTPVVARAITGATTGSTFWAVLEGPDKVVGGSGGSMVYPGAGIAVSNGTGWSASLTAPSSGIVGVSDVQSLTNKQVDGISSTIFGYLSTLRSDVQVQIDAKQASGSYLTGNQTITLGGDLSGSGATSINATVSKVNGAPVPVSAPCLQSNALGQLLSTSCGTGVGGGTITLMNNSGTSINTNFTTLQFDSNFLLTDATNGVGQIGLGANVLTASSTSTVTNKTLTSPILDTPSLQSTPVVWWYTAGSGGTTANTVVKIVSDGTTLATGTQGIVIGATTSDTANFIGVVLDTAGQGTAVRVAVYGVTRVFADGTVSALDIVGAGTTTAGNGKSLGTSSRQSVSSALQLLGRALTSATNGTLYYIHLAGPFQYGGLTQTAQGGLGTALSPTRAGDVIYWNGSSFAILAGNNSGTNCLQESSSGVPSWSACGSGGGPTTNQNIRSITFGFSNGTSALSSGDTYCVAVPYSGTITSATIYADIAGSGVVDIQAIGSGSYTGSSSASSIAASAKPTLSSQSIVIDSTLTGWTKTVSGTPTAPQMFCGVLSSPSTAHKISVTLSVAAN